MDKEKMIEAALREYGKFINTQADMDTLNELLTTDFNLEGEVIDIEEYVELEDEHKTLIEDIKYVIKDYEKTEGCEDLINELNKLL